MRQEEMLNPPVLGWYPLRQAIASYLNISRGLSCTAEQVLITSGYSGSLRLILDTLASRSDKVVFEDPAILWASSCSSGSCRACTRCRSIAAASTRTTCSATIATPVLPSSPRRTRARWRSRSLPRKQQLLDWASQNEAWIIEDDYDGEFHYTRKVLPSLKSLDQHDRVILWAPSVKPSCRRCAWATW
jgi:GntR family transcriptional regulator/MocR family aminotransferase